MIDPKYIELMHRRLDGEITPADDAELTAHLDSSSEARALYEQLSGTIKAVASVAPVEAPADLKAEILASIGRAPRRAEAPQRSLREVMMSVFTPRLSYGLAAGVILGIAIGTIGSRGLGSHNSIDPSSLAGTITSGGVPKEARRIDNDSFQNDRFAGRVTIDEVKGAIWVRIEMESGDDVAMNLSMGDPAWTLKGFAQSAPVQSALATTESGLYLTHHGKNAYVFVLDGNDQNTSVLSLRLECQGIVYQRDINTQSRS
jgi:hypothetical protein